jgi:hypothetical protein
VKDITALSTVFIFPEALSVTSELETVRPLDLWIRSESIVSHRLQHVFTTFKDSQAVLNACTAQLEIVKSQPQEPATAPPPAEAPAQQEPVCSSSLSNGNIRF